MDNRFKTRQNMDFPLSTMRDKRGDFVRIDNPADTFRAEPPNESAREPTSVFRIWWWWEISALVLSIASTAGLIALLKTTDNTPLRKWGLPVQPNSVIAALTTISKAALLVPAASCLSQLKWRYFGSKPRKLSDLQLFDGASRGPWGSLLFLFQVSNLWQALIAVGLSLVTILTLGLDITTQQLLAFPLQETNVTNGTIDMGSATGYISKSSNLQVQDQGLNTKIIPFQLEVLNSLQGSTFNSFFSCPPEAARCTWDNITTMGVCSTWNSASVASDGCDMASETAPGGGGNTTYATCNYTMSNNHSGNPELAAALYPVTPSLSFRIPSVDFNSGNKILQSGFIPGFYTTNIEVGEFFALRAASTSTKTTSEATFEPPKADAFFASFFWCSRTYKGITTKPGGVVKYAEETSEPLHYLFNTTVDAAIAGSQSYTYQANKTGLRYELDEGTYEALTEYLHSLLATTALDQALALADGSIFNTGRLLYLQDLQNMTNSLADSLTNLMRSSTPDENFNVTNIPGQAFYDERYIRVRYIWLILPVAITALITLLFVSSVVVSSRTPLLKDSVLAYLATNVRDDAGRASDMSMMQWNSQQDLDDTTKGVLVRLESDKQGYMNFFRKDI
ncbi:hypothetical protein F4808DRAFT_442603 [Astrocystis sublimbata]|nr:hypothetical protein F4808DRAFT_442603 [Astrocystis sublimbata]